MPSLRRHLNLSPWALLLGLSASGQAQAPPAQTSTAAQPTATAPTDLEALPHLPALLWTDTKVVFRAPAAWDASDWHHFWLGAAGVVVVGVALDGPVDRAFKRSARPSWDRTAKDLAFLGGTGSVLIAGGTYLGGAAFGNRELRSVGIDLGMAMAIAQLGLALPIKALAGRSRPLKDEGTSHFRPLQSSQSFPSSHTVQAFVLASVISEHADQPWVTGLSYGLASLVGVARLEQRQHFVSDVLGGALIGTFVGRTVTRYNQAQRAGTSSVKVAFQPLLSGEYKGAVVRVNF